jgi:deoxyribose-phosphate aldolase
MTVEQFAKTIDHSLLRPELTEEEVVAGCELARRYHVASVCVKPYHIKLATKILTGSDVLVSTVVGFPHGCSTTESKVDEAKQALDDGAVELDMVINIGELRSGHYDYVRDEVKSVCHLAHARDAKVKVILENAYLTDAQKVMACKLCDDAGADWVKTSTGFAPSGATLADIRLMRASVSSRVQLKAAHGVRTLASALEMIEAGVTRIGATATQSMIEDFEKWKAGDLRLESKTGEPAGY